MLPRLAADIESVLFLFTARLQDLDPLFIASESTDVVGRLCQTPWRFTETPYNQFRWKSRA